MSESFHFKYAAEGSPSDSSLSGGNPPATTAPVVFSVGAPVAQPVNTINNSSNANTTQPPPAYANAAATEQTVKPRAEANVPLVTFSLRTLTGQLMRVQLPADVTSLNNPSAPARPMPNLSILNIKQRLEGTHNIPAHLQRLIFAGRELQDHELCAQHDLRDGCMLHLLLRQNRPSQPPPPQPAYPAGPNVYGQPGHARGYGQPPPNVPPPQMYGQPPPQPYMQGGMAYQYDQGAGEMPAIVIPVGMGPIMLTDEDRMRLAKTFQLSRAVRIFSIIDTIFFFLWAWTYLPLLAGVVLVIGGYYGARYYKPSLLVLYIIYIVLSIGVRIFWIVEQPSIMLIIILILGILVQFYILYLVVMFLKLVKLLTPAERDELLLINNAVHRDGVVQQ